VSTIGPNDEVRYLSTKNVAEYVFSVDFSQIPLNFVHQSMEKFVNVSLNPWINRLPIKYKLFAKGQSIIGRTL